MARSALLKFAETVRLKHQWKVCGIEENFDLPKYCESQVCRGTNFENLGSNLIFPTILSHIKYVIYCHDMFHEI